MATDKFEFPDEKEETTVTVQPDNEVEVEVVDDTPQQDRGRKPLDREVEDPTDEEIESYSDKVKGRIKELTHARHDERRVKESVLREKQELENFTRRLMEENKQLKGAVNTGTQQHVATAQHAAMGELEKARRAYKDAQEAFDTDAIIAAQESVTDAKMRIEALKNFRPAPMQANEDMVQMPQSAPQRVQPDEKSLRWQAKNQWFGAQGFEEVTSYALGLHQKLVNTGVDPRDDEYFKQIDTRIKSKFPEVFSGNEATSQPSETSRKPATTVASATRSSGPKKIQISSSAMALAKKFGLTPQQYAVQVALLERNNG